MCIYVLMSTIVCYQPIADRKAMEIIVHKNDTTTMNAFVLAVRLKVR